MLRGQMIKENNLARFGGTCSILVGILYGMTSIAYLLDPARKVANNYEFWQAVAQDPMMEIIFHAGLALCGIFGLAVVPAISQLVRGGNEGWMQWTSKLAYLGFAVGAVEHFRALTLVPRWAAAFVDNDTTYQTAIVATHLTAELDPDGWLSFGGVGLWILGVNLLVLRQAKLPKALALVGIAVTILYWFVLAGVLLKISLLISIAAGLGGMIVMPLWYIWIGQLLRRVH